MIEESTTGGAAVQATYLSLLGYRPGIQARDDRPVATLRADDLGRVPEDVRLRAIALDVIAQGDGYVLSPADRAYASTRPEVEWTEAATWAVAALPTLRPIADRLSSWIAAHGETDPEVVSNQVDAGICWAHGPIPGDRTEFLEASRAQMRRELA